MYIRKTLVLSAVVKMYEIMHGKQHGNKPKYVLLSAIAVKKSIGNITEDLRGKKSTGTNCTMCEICYRVDVHIMNIQMFLTSQFIVFARFYFCNKM